MAHRAPLIISEYSPSWLATFLKEKAAIQDALGDKVFEIEHIGSTAIVGLAAKPIIDIMLGCSELSRLDAAIPILERIGYEYMPQNEIELPDRRFLAKPIVRPRSVHLHGLALGGAAWNNHLLFRDSLRTDKNLVMQYEALKRTLAEKYYDDRASYTQAKTDFIRSVLHHAGKKS